ncbi:MAG: hypothetical protein R3C17_18215 [Planctomycetaceae bacterium]
MTPLPFSHLNLRRNPFGELTAEERTALAVVEIGPALQHLKQPRAAVQFVGEKGYGKTTHLLVLASHFAHGTYIHIPEGRRVTIPSVGDPLLIDEAQRLTKIQQWLIFRSRRRLILGTHEDFEQSLCRADRPALTIAADRFTNEGRVHTLLNARIQFARRADGPIPSVTLQTASRLFTQFGSDIRSIEHSMYQTIQLLRDIQDV